MVFETTEVGGEALLAKQWHNRARGTEHVTEAHNAEAGLGFNLGKALQNQLCKPLGGAHHIGGTNRFIGRDQDESVNTGLLTDFNQIFGSKHIVFETF